MGRPKKNTRGRGGKSNATPRPQKDGRNDDGRSDLLVKADMVNDKFAKYYKAQNIIPEGDWDSFLDTMRTPLPTTFRLAGSRQTAQELNTTITNVYVPILSNAEFEGEKVPPPVQIPWYPDGLAWQFNVPKKVLRKSTEFKKFHSFLVFETEVGNVSRQEAVSMLPPLLLDVKPHHVTIDMCAAPGSKTAQLLEAMHANDSATSTSTPKGMLIANDSDHKRTHLLIHQSARLPSPALIVTNLDASIYPVMKVPMTSLKTLNGTPIQESDAGKLQQLLFDRILCDVPCSGDGTMRKNMGIWKSWTPMDGNGLHGLQFRILQRAMNMLKPDGRIVYSTCSLNPVENEAVIAAALELNPAFELVDVSDRLPALKRSSGLTAWNVTTDKNVEDMYDSYESFLMMLRERNTADEERKRAVLLSGEERLTHDAKTELDRKKSEAKITKGHFAPVNAVELGLARCIRVEPQLQDTGGFFVAVLRRKVVAPSDSADRKRPAEDEAEVPEIKKVKLDDDATAAEEPAATAETPAESTPTPAAGSNQRSQYIVTKTQAKGKGAESGGGSFKENPYTFLKSTDEILQTCLQKLNLTSEFPSSNVFVRNPEGEAVRSMYLTNDIVKAVVESNDYNKIRLTACGTKVFGKQEAGRGVDAMFRILGEGLPVVLPYTAPESILDGDMAVLRVLVAEYYPMCSSFPEPFRSVILAKDSGSHVVRFPAGIWGAVSLTHELILPLWKSNVSITLMIDKKAKSAMSMRIFHEDITSNGKDAQQQLLKNSVPSGTATPAAKEEESSEMVVDNSVTPEEGTMDEAKAEETTEMVVVDESV